MGERVITQKTKFISTPSGTAVIDSSSSSKLKRTNSEEILSQEIPDGITLPSIIHTPVEVEYSFIEIPDTNNTNNTNKTNNTDNTDNSNNSKNKLSNKNNRILRKTTSEESLLELPPIRGRQRKRTFTEGYDEQGARLKFSYN